MGHQPDGAPFHEAHGLRRWRGRERCCSASSRIRAAVRTSRGPTLAEPGDLGVSVTGRRGGVGRPNDVRPPALMVSRWRPGPRPHRTALTLTARSGALPRHVGAADDVELAPSAEDDVVGVALAGRRGRASLRSKGPGVATTRGRAVGMLEGEGGEGRQGLHFRHCIHPPPPRRPAASARWPKQLGGPGSSAATTMKAGSGASRGGRRGD
jgi:hypothetical protein